MKFFIMATSASTSQGIGHTHDEIVSYSDFMRRLAAKYNNTSSNNETTSETRKLLDPPFDVDRLKVNGLNLTETTPFTGFNILFNKNYQTTSTFPILAGLAAASRKKKKNSSFKAQTSFENSTLINLINQKVLKRSSLDIPSHNRPNKIIRKEYNNMGFLCNSIPCSDETKTVQGWSVNEVCEFVESIEICRPFVHVFREQSIDGFALLLLTEEHLVNKMNMKLGPVLKFKAAIATKIGSCPVCLHCLHCHIIDTSSNYQKQNKEGSSYDPSSFSLCKSKYEN